jgi:2-succinyl-6-hydroxy-2,4-cyclohexadiene-1-carboxylate synthase
MKIDYSGISFNVNIPHEFNESSRSIFLLHGFTGSSEDWNPVLPGIEGGFNKVTVDLIGHGKSDSPGDPALYTWEYQVEQLNGIITHLTQEKVILVGYSMGGRLALCYANTYPERVAGLILESTSPGIKDRKQRNKRIKEDEELSNFISSHSIADFIEYWINKEIFGTLLRFSEKKRNEIKRKKLVNNIIGLTNSLSGFGTGKMPDLYPSLKRSTIKTLLLTGELDSKFTAINQNLVQNFPSAKHEIIKNAGHPIHLEEPVKFLAAVNRFIKNLGAIK